MELDLIAAIGRNRELGLDGDMPWKNSLKQDLKFFSRTTKGHAMLMGKRTFESLPGVLPGREHLIVTTSNMPEQEHVHIYKNLEEFFEDWKDRDETVFVIGGGSIYKQMLPYADKLILTEIDQVYSADTWFPDFDKARYKKSTLDRVEENGVCYEHVCYERLD